MSALMNVMTKLVTEKPQCGCRYGILVTVTNLPGVSESTVSAVIACLDVLNTEIRLYATVAMSSETLDGLWYHRKCPCALLSTIESDHTTTQQFLVVIDCPEHVDMLDHKIPSLASLLSA